MKNWDIDSIMRVPVIEVMTRLHTAHKVVAGTSEYNRYVMEVSAKIDGRWKFLSWGMPPQPSETAVLKRSGGKLHILVGTWRYTLNDAHMELLGSF